MFGGPKTPPRLPRRSAHRLGGLRRQPLHRAHARWLACLGASTNVVRGSPIDPASLHIGALAVRLVVLDDVALYRDGLRTILSGRDDMIVVGEGTANRDGVKVVCALAPDIVLVEASAIRLTTIVRDVLRLAPRVRLLAYGVSSEEREALQCAESGVSGYVSRDATTAELVETVRSVSRGEFACSPRLGALLLRRLSDLVTQQRGYSSHVVLTRREREVGELIDDGLSNKEIASRLGIGVSTVKNHVHHLLEKLHATRRVQAAAHMRRARI
jgi:two-component system, NarL family, nitrate/nitrite response regulator NarL